MALRQQGGGQVPVALAQQPGRLALPHGVEHGEVVGAASSRRWYSVADTSVSSRSSDVQQDGDRLARIRIRRRVRLRHGLACPLGRHPLVAGQLRGGPGARVRVGQPRHREDDRLVLAGAAGHRRVQPLPGLLPGDDGQADADGQALRAVRGGRVAELGVGEVTEREHALRPGPRPGGRVPVGAAPHHQRAVIGDGLDAHDVAVRQRAAFLAGLQARGRCAGR